MTRDRPVQGQVLPVFRADDFACSDGANMGDAISIASDLVLDDVYELPFAKETDRLSVLLTDGRHLEISDDSLLGTAHATVHLDCVLSFMSPDGKIDEALLLVEVDQNDSIADIYLMPLTSLRSGTEYRLVGIDRENARQKFAQVASVSFTRGTHIALATGEQCLVEDLNVGDAVLTRDHGVQNIRWIGQTTVRAVGEMAPIRIHAGALNNVNDLIVSPDHRLFVYQRSDEVGAGRSELLVKARHLVNGYTVTVMEGGFVDYFQLLFDTHQIIYAEGISAETMLIDSRTKPALPEGLYEAISTATPLAYDLSHTDFNADDPELNRRDLVELLRKASSR